MHRYIPTGPEEKEALLQELGLSSTEDLFQSIPAALRKPTAAHFTPAMSEIELRRYFQHSDVLLAEHSFAGGLGHSHYIPSIIDPLISRGEFLTAYTPYQPEVSQGTLQAMFEYQSMMAHLMGVEVSNASLYDGSTAVIEAISMALRISGKSHVQVSGLLHPEYIETIQTYAAPGVFSFDLIAGENGRLGAFKVGPETGAVVVQSPNYFGLLEDIKKIKEMLPAPVLLIAVVTEALSLAYLKSPGSLGADIVCGEAQSFGIPLMAGGPWLGFLGSAMAHVRNMPGRLVGQAYDREGRRGFVVTLATREQHIRRARATSNICTNQGLMALRASIYLSVMGKRGLYRAAQRSHRFATLGRKLIAQHSEIRPAHEGPMFNEFVIDLPIRAELVIERCLESQRILPGTALDEKRLLVAFSELLSPKVVEKWALLLAAACK
ncbi:MAG: aminomethyl-transferring glycine dehydrogenase subunit GcvPA [Spirochaetales bacterium]|nr:aminomethyl-transferring glycine dehydrogenase subunit GcvPA [Spirochaetales bacterium]